MRTPEEHLQHILTECEVAVERCRKHSSAEVRGAASLAANLLRLHFHRPLPGADLLFSYVRAELEALESGEYEACLR